MQNHVKKRKIVLFVRNITQWSIDRFYYKKHI